MKHYQKSKYSSNPLVTAESTPTTTESSNTETTAREEPEFIMVEMTSLNMPLILLGDILPSTQLLRNQPVQNKKTPTPLLDPAPDPSNPPSPTSNSIYTSIPTPTQDTTA